MASSYFPFALTTLSRNRSSIWHRQALQLLLLLALIGCIAGAIATTTTQAPCPIGKKPSPTATNECVYLSNNDVSRSVRAMAYPAHEISMIFETADRVHASATAAGSDRYTNSYYTYNNRCSNFTVSQGIRVCEDFLPMSVREPTFSSATSSISLQSSAPESSECIIYSIIATSVCMHLGSLEFEKYWSLRGCVVKLFHFTYFYKGNNCEYQSELDAYPNIKATVYDVWGGKGYVAFYKQLPPPDQPQPPIAILKIQGREGVLEDFDGLPYCILSDLFLHRNDFYRSIHQLVFTAAINSETLVDSVGRESEYAWNMWATSKFLNDFEAIYSERKRGIAAPLQFDHILDSIELDTHYAYYRHTFIQHGIVVGLTRRSEKNHVDTKQLERDKYEMEIEEKRKKNDALVESYTIVESKKHRIKGRVPLYCSVPSSADEREMQAWIDKELLVRCHATRLWVNCDFDRSYDAFIPCKQELVDNLSEDYAASKGWCNFNSKPADLPALQKVPKEASVAFQVKKRPESGVRLAFFFTIYHDTKQMTRLIQRLYSEDHYYLLHVDAGGSTLEFEKDMQKLASSMPVKNIFVVREVPIVYGASTATIVLVKAMAWFLRHASGWDYFVPVTGADYPLVPLHRIEKMFSYQLNILKNPQPFVMAWSPGTSTHLFRLATTHPFFDKNSLVKGSIFPATVKERGDPLGSGGRFMEYRSNNFGPPLLCNSKHSFYHLDNRRNKSGTYHDSQWLFPRDRFPKRGRAYSEEDPVKSYLPPDGKFRVWKKSDPATTGAYDLETIRYIVESEEGKKYFHFFKHMLLGSEEHYFVNLLYNWERTKVFVQSLSAQIVWNTWELGLWEQAGGFQTHTHFLTSEEWPIIKGFALRGMIFARKFSSKKTPELIDRIDSYIHMNKSTDAGLFWPGYFQVDQLTPGKHWIAESRKNTSREHKAKYREYTRGTVRDAIRFASDNEDYTEFYMKQLVGDNII